MVEARSVNVKTTTTTTTSGVTCILQAFGWQICHAVFLWCCYACFFYRFCFRFRLYAFIEAVALHSIVLRYACAPAATRNYLTSIRILSRFSFLFFSFLFFFFFFLRCRFIRAFLYHCRFLFKWRVRRTSYVFCFLFSFRMVFGLDSWYQLRREFNQPIYQSSFDVQNTSVRGK